MAGLSKAINAEYRRRGRIADGRAKQLTQAGMRSVGRDRVGWWEHVGSDRNVRSIITRAGTQTSPGGIRMSEFAGGGYAHLHPPYSESFDVASVQLGSGKTSSMLMASDYIRVDGSVEGGCGGGLTSSSAGDVLTVIVSLQPSLVLVPSDIALTNEVANNCSASVTEITESKFNLNITSTGGGAFLYEAHFATLPGDQDGGGGGGGGGSGPTFGIDRMANQSTNLTGLDFIILRRSIGLSEDGQSWAQDAFDRATAAGLEVIFYHFGRGPGHGGGTGAAEANFFIDKVEEIVGVGNAGNYGLAFDWEPWDGYTTPEANVQSFISTVQGTGAKCGLYTYWYFRKGGFPYGEGQDWHWVSYVVHPNHKPPGRYDIWQYDVRTRFGSYTDLDRSEMNLADLAARIH